MYRGRLSVLVVLIDSWCPPNSCADTGLKASTSKSMPRLPRRGRVGVRSEMEMSDVPVQYALTERLQALHNLDP